MSDCELVEDTSYSVAKGDHALFSKGKDCINPTAVYLPPSLANAKELNVILWLHGHRVKTMKDVFGPAAGTGSVPDDAAHDEAKGTMLRESVLASGKDVVLIAPFLGYHWTEKKPDPAHPGKFIIEGHGPYTLGKLGNKGGVQTYLDEVLRQIAQWGKSTRFQGTSLFDMEKLEKLEKLVIACHSGGGDKMREATATMGDDFRKKLTECWGFDCMYADGNTYGTWADGLPGTIHYFYLAKGSTASYFVEFWRFAYGTHTNPEPKLCMHNVCLAPAVRGIESLSEGEILQSVDDIQRKKKGGTKLSTYEEIRDKVDPLLDDGVASSKYGHAVSPHLKQHFEVVRDVLKPRIIGLFGAKPLGIRVMKKAMQDALDACKAKGSGTKPAPATKAHDKSKKKTTL
jgi:hypothetical protein